VRPARPSALLLASLSLLACAQAPLRTAADYRARVAELRDEAPPGFLAVAAPPFVVVGDGPVEVVRAEAHDTVAWAVRLLRADFFAREPEDLITIWLFDGETSYLHHANALFGDIPPSPYGYYSSWHDALIINAASGRGTIVHEIVHPFIAADFPGCPPWMDEGLASLFEQPAERDGRLVGRTNWRLPGLQLAIERGRLPSFEELLEMSGSEFREEETAGRNYAQARYLLHYLQERDLLRGFYRRFRAARHRDPSGIETLRATLGERDLTGFQKRWERYVLGLSFPE